MHQVTYIYVMFTLPKIHLYVIMMTKKSEVYTHKSKPIKIVSPKEQFVVTYNYLWKVKFNGAEIIVIMYSVFVLLSAYNLYVVQPPSQLTYGPGLTCLPFPLDSETYHHFYYVFPPYYRYILSLLVSRMLY